MHVSGSLELDGQLVLPNQWVPGYVAYPVSKNKEQTDVPMPTSGLHRYVHRYVHTSHHTYIDRHREYKNKRTSISAHIHVCSHYVSYLSVICPGDKKKPDGCPMGIYALRTREMSQWLRALTHFQRLQIQFQAPMWWYTTTWNYSLRGSNALFWPSWALGTPVVQRYACRRNTHTHEVKGGNWNMHCS